ncbi:hypothetical protein [Arcicella lustrica]|uniref:ParB/Sulfiredoxin domain-containing protein n=1 Tax=Arcicella lustrica TaxID=2984196 RepID=A0ABU5SKV9_9BACT|nr:hypothetical protein [Arcicella sp. DC25W]MEA5427939.1 hypothetical protein [Arcicella sp. DC25W]
MKGIDFKKQLALSTANTLKNNKLISSENIKNNLIILAELKDFIPPLNNDEFSSLEESIIANGCRTPLLIWDTTQGVINPTSENPNDAAFVLFDGHHRYEICKRNGIDFQIDLMSFPTIEDVKDFMIDFQVGRRNMTSEQISYLRGLKYQRLRAKQGGVRTGKGVEDLILIDTASKLAQEFNVSPATIKRDAVFAQGLDKMNNELKGKVLNGKTKVDKKSIQQLAKSDIEKPITSVEELNSILEKNQYKPVFSNETEERKALLSKVNNSIKNASETEITIEIKGSFIIKNALESTWKQLRVLSEEVLIDENFTDRISLSEAISLGIVREG